MMMTAVAILGSILVIIGVVWEIMPSIPMYPEHLISSLNFFLDIVFDNIQLLDIFIRIDTIKLVVPILIALINLDKIYALVMWLLNKIPFINLD